VLWRNDNGALSLWTSTGNGLAENTFFDGSVPASAGWHIEGTGDFDGDGRDDLIWRNDAGALSIWQASGSGFAKNVYADATVPGGSGWSIDQVGDFNSDGRADILWHNASGAISIWQSNGSGFDKNVLFNNGPTADWSVAAHEFPLI
jgi:hypothetical protein